MVMMPVSSAEISKVAPPGDVLIVNVVLVFVNT